jgi:hypothetical protein
MPYNPKKCVDCTIKLAAWGLPNQKTLSRDMRGKRWCSECAKKQDQVVDMRSGKCIDCKVKYAFYGEPNGENKRLYCAGCMLAHPGVVDLQTKKCEDCKKSTSNYGFAAEAPRTRWCA